MHSSDNSGTEVPVPIKVLPHGEGLALPAYATEGAAGMDGGGVGKRKSGEQGEPRRSPGRNPPRTGPAHGEVR